MAQANTTLDLLSMEPGHNILADGKSAAMMDDKCETLFLDVEVLQFPYFQEPYVQVPPFLTSQMFTTY